MLKAMKGFDEWFGDGKSNDSVEGKMADFLGRWKIDVLS